jgi:hypothetical protein
MYPIVTFEPIPVDGGWCVDITDADGNTIHTTEIFDSVSLAMRVARDWAERRAPRSAE